MSGSRDLFQQAMNKGHSAAWDQDWEQAANFYLQAIDEIPDNPQALTSLGLALFELQQFDEALKVYARAASTSVDDPIPVEKVSQLYERLGNVDKAVKSARRAADLYLKKRDSEKAIENLVRATRLNPQDLAVRSRLAIVYEGLGRKQPAVSEYLSIASLIQKSGNMDKAIQVVDHAITISPGSADAHQALELLQNSKPLPEPLHSHELLDDLNQTEDGIPEQSEMISHENHRLDPITESQNKALTILAGLLFEPNRDNVNAASQGEQSIQDLDEGESIAGVDQAERNNILLHLSQAVNLQTQGINDKAAEELELAVEAGINHPAALFNLGLLRSKSTQIDSALQALQRVIDHPDFALAAHLIRGTLFQRLDRLDDAVIEYLEALKIAETQSVDADQVDELWQSYGLLINAKANQREAQRKESFCDCVGELLLRDDWRSQLSKARQDLQVHGAESSSITLGEILLEASSIDIIESVASIHRLSEAGFLRSAMEEAYYALNFGPIYLPLHKQIGDILLRQDRLPEALEKFSLIAKTYSVRGNKKQSVEMLKRILELAPANLSSRDLLIQQLFEAGQIDDAITEVFKLSEFYINQAELRKARSTYSEALDYAQKANAQAEKIALILHQMADIDMQSLNWQQALQIFTQIRKLLPGDEQARLKLVELNLRIGKEAKAQEELDSYLEYLVLIGEIDKAIDFTENLLQENPDLLMIRSRLANLYGQNGRLREALTHYNAVGQAYLKVGNRSAAVEIVESILALNPPNRSDYERLINRLRNS